MECPGRDYPTLASRLVMEYWVLQLVLERRVKTKKPNLGKGVEHRIISRNLEELEE